MQVGTRCHRRQVEKPVEEGHGELHVPYDANESWSRLFHMVGEHARYKLEETHNEEGASLLAEESASEGLPHLGIAAL